MKKLCKVKPWLIIGSLVALISLVSGLFSVVQYSIFAGYLTLIATTSLVLYFWKNCQTASLIFWIPLALFFILAANSIFVHVSLSNSLLERILLVLTCIGPAYSVYLVPKEPRKKMLVYRAVAFFPALIGVFLSIMFSLMPLSSIVESFYRGNAVYELRLEESAVNSTLNKIAMYKTSSRLSLFRVRFLLPGIEIRELQDSVFSKYGNLRYDLKDQNTIIVFNTGSEKWPNPKRIKIPTN